jgi:hypothetical protein
LYLTSRRLELTLEALIRRPLDLASQVADRDLVRILLGESGC